MKKGIPLSDLIPNLPSNAKDSNGQDANPEPIKMSNKRLINMQRTMRGLSKSLADEALHKVMEKSKIKYKDESPFRFHPRRMVYIPIGMQNGPVNLDFSSFNESIVYKDQKRRNSSNNALSLVESDQIEKARYWETDPIERIKAIDETIAKDLRIREEGLRLETIQKIKKKMFEEFMAFKVPQGTKDKVFNKIFHKKVGGALSNFRAIELFKKTKMQERIGELKIAENNKIEEENEKSLKEEKSIDASKQEKLEDLSGNFQTQSKFGMESPKSKFRHEKKQNILDTPKKYLRVFFQDESTGKKIKKELFGSPTQKEAFNVHVGKQNAALGQKKLSRFAKIEHKLKEKAPEVNLKDDSMPRSAKSASEDQKGFQFKTKTFKKSGFHRHFTIYDKYLDNGKEAFELIKEVTRDKNEADQKDDETEKYMDKVIRKAHKKALSVGKPTQVQSKPKSEKVSQSQDRLLFNSHYRNLFPIQISQDDRKSQTARTDRGIPTFSKAGSGYHKRHLSLAIPGYVTHCQKHSRSQEPFQTDAEIHRSENINNPENGFQTQRKRIFNSGAVSELFIFPLTHGIMGEESSCPLNSNRIMANSNSLLVENKKSSTHCTSTHASFAQSKMLWIHRPVIKTARGKSGTIGSLYSPCPVAGVKNAQTEEINEESI